jgi:ADP-ribose pyrophosphatase YjhB (NUDIX family)
MVNVKRVFSALWKKLSKNARWRVLWLISDHYALGVTAVVLNARGELLIAHHVFRDQIAWGLPGGGVKHGESLEQATHREILEETGLECEVSHLLQVNLDVRRPLLNCYFLCEVEGTPQPHPNRELFEVGFYALDALPGTIDPDQWAIIQRAMQVHASEPRVIPTGWVRIDDG